MKAATTSVFDVLRKHPQICPSCVKEPEYFSEVQLHGPNTDRYENLFAFDESVHTFSLEASTGYTKFPVEMGVTRRIFEYGLNPYFIYSVRDPN